MKLLIALALSVGATAQAAQESAYSVLNRSDAKNIEVEAQGGIASYDEFVSSQTAGIRAYYRFTPDLSAGINVQRAWSRSSDSQEALKNQFRLQSNTNFYRGYMGLETAYRFLNLSTDLIDIEMAARVGVGALRMESGSTWSPSVGLSQTFVFSPFWGIRAGYQMNFFEEKIVSKGNNGISAGSIIGSRRSTMGSLTLGAVFRI